MADAKSIAGEVEGDYSTVKVQLTGGLKGDKVVRPTKGSQVVWGGTDPSSPWAHLMALIDKAGGSVSYTFIHAADLHEPVVVAETKDEPAQDDTPPAEPTKPAGAPAAAPKTPVTHSAGGAEGHGFLFEEGLDFKFGGSTARVWAHPHTLMAGPRPLVISLHGINAGQKMYYPALNEKWLHVGKIASKLIEEGKVTPLVIAAPTEFSNTPWGGFDLAKFVQAVVDQCKAQNVEIDLDAVSLVGHSGAGGYNKRGVNKMAEEGAQFDGHKLKILAFTDTCITSDNAKAYHDGLKDNSVTTIYGMHKGTGGWPSYGGSQSFAKALGAESKGTVDKAEDEQDVDDYYDNGGKAPLRISIRIKTAKLANHHKEWKEAGGYPTSVGSHWDMVPMWFWWALPRFYAATEEDKVAGAQPHKIDALPIDDPPAPTVTGGEWANVAAAPPVWSDAPGKDPKATGDALFAPATGIYWPVRASKVHEGRAVCYIDSDGKGHGGYKNTASGRNFLADRPAGSKSPDRFHVGIDLYANFHDIIVACEAGTIIQVKPFYLGVWKVMVKHKDVVINYGEVDKDSIKKYGLKVGDTVAPGQPLAEAGRMVHDSMLHFEMYPPGTGDTTPYFRKEGEKSLKRYFNPTAYLLALATKGK